MLTHSMIDRVLSLECSRVHVNVIFNIYIIEVIVKDAHKTNFETLHSFFIFMTT